MNRLPCFLERQFRLPLIRSLSRFADIIESEKCQRYCDGVVQRFEGIKTGANTGVDNSSSETISRWQLITEAHHKLLLKQEERSQLALLAAENSDPEIKALVAEDTTRVAEELDEFTDELAHAIIPKTELDMLNKCQLEFSAGAGGVEAQLFADEIFEMYRKFAEGCGWSWMAVQYDKVAGGGLRSALVLLEGLSCYSVMRFEAGTHRVQRIPFNASIMHTSTMNMAVLPEPDNPEVIIPPNEVKVETMRASGPGGQNVNKRSSAVRITHIPSGTSVHSMEERFQHLNIKIAHKRLAAILMQKKVDDLSSKTVSARKLQVGSRARAEKIRTYNFKDDRITDHRLKMSVNHVEGFLNAGIGLESFVNELKFMDLKERLVEEIESQ